jgi:hypothetical protein
MNTSEIKLGSFSFWLTWKVISVFILIVVPVVVFNSADLNGPMRFVLLGIALALVIISNEELVYGRASEEGIHIRRYFLEIFLPWHAILSIQWSSQNTLRFRLKKGFLFRKNIAVQSFGGRLTKEWLSEPPEVVKWLLVAKPLGAEGIELVGPGI